MTRSYSLIVLSTAFGAAFASAPLYAQTCQGNGDIGGAYAFVGSRSTFATIPTTPPAKNGSNNTGSTSDQNTTPAVSGTAIGQLIGDFGNPAPFSVVGRIVADGSGNLFAGPNATGALMQVGTYSVNIDCTISVTLTDAFLGMAITPPGTSGATGSTHVGSNTSTGMNGNNTATPVSMQFVGIVLDRGAEIDLTQTGSADTGAVITMRRALQFGACTDASLSGTFGVVSQITTTSAATGGSGTSPLTPISVVGRLVPDGAGMFVSDPMAKQSSIQALQLTGTYSVNADCTGSAQFTDATGMTRNLTFVIVQADQIPPSTGLVKVRPELLFSFSDQGVSGFGYAK